MLEVANGVQKIASIFELLKRPATRTVNGLFGELSLFRVLRKLKTVSKPGDRRRIQLLTSHLALAD